MSKAALQKVLLASFSGQAFAAARSCCTEGFDAEPSPKDFPRALDKKFSFDKFAPRCGLISINVITPKRFGQPG
jgi:hypothetical protein